MWRGGLGNAAILRDVTLIMRDEWVGGGCQAPAAGDVNALPFWLCNQSLCM